MNLLNAVTSFGDEAAGKQAIRNIINTQTVSSETAQSNIINKVLFYLGMLAILAIIISGVKFATSGGDPGAVQKAKQALLYSIIGLAVVLLAYAIVNFVLTKVTT